MQILHPQPLFSQAFTPFGSVISAPPLPGRHVVAELQQSRQTARPILGVSRIAARPIPLAITMLERHRYSSQTFVQMSGGQYLILVGEAADEPQISRLLLFVSNGRQGVSYSPGIWHHPIIPIEEDATFATMIWKADDGEDEEFFQLGLSLNIDFFPSP